MGSYFYRHIVPYDTGVVQYQKYNHNEILWMVNKAIRCHFYNGFLYQVYQVHIHLARYHSQSDILTEQHNVLILERN